jgi:hypothetical protein
VNVEAVVIDGVVVPVRDLTLEQATQARHALTRAVLRLQQATAPRDGDARQA